MLNVKCYYRNRKCNPTLVSLYHRSVPEVFFSEQPKKRKHLRYVTEIKSPITGDFAMSRLKKE